MKTFISIVFVVIFLGIPTLTKVRKDYVRAINDKEITIQLSQNLDQVQKKDNKVLVAYKGAVLTLMAKFSKTKSEKKTYFKEGAILINFAVSEQPNNIEIRCIRLGVQENAPKIVGYRKNKVEDKQFILDHYKEVSSKEIKNFIKNFVATSKSFSEDEKLLFN